MTRWQRIKPTNHGTRNQLGETRESSEGGGIIEAALREEQETEKSRKKERKETKERKKEKKKRDCS